MGRDRRDPLGASRRPVFLNGEGARPKERKSALDADAQAQLASSWLSPTERYAWSWIRIWEQVTINILTVVMIAIGGALFALVYQHFFNFIVVPTNLLLAVAFTGTGILVTVALLALGMFLYMRKHPLAASFALLALVLGAASGGRNLFELWADDETAKAQAKQAQNAPDE